MNKQTAFKFSLFAAAMLALSGAQAANINKADYDAGKSRISADYDTDKAACKTMAGNAKDVCMDQAKAKEKVAKAELEYSYTGKGSDWNKVQVAKAETTYAVEKEKCDDQAGNAKDVCRKEAKAVETKALADAKMEKKIHKAKVADADDKRDADYKVAAEKCDAMSGDAKSTCIANAKATYGKS